MILVLLLCGCAHEKNVYTSKNDDTVRVTRITEKKDSTYDTVHVEPGPTVVYTRIHFRVEGPEEFRGREIVVPIIGGLEGELFDKHAFTIRIPRYILEGKRSIEIKMPDGSVQAAYSDGFSFDGIVVK